jgi:hypothetical protein
MTEKSNSSPNYKESTTIVLNETTRKPKVNFKTSKFESLELDRNALEKCKKDFSILKQYSYTCYVNKINLLFIKDSRYSDFNDYLPEILEDTLILPDISVMCGQCKTLIELTNLNDHKELHDALNIFDFKELPSNMNDLCEKRTLLVKNSYTKYMKNKALINENAIEWNRKITLVNDAFELLKSYVNNTFDMNRQLRYAIKKLEVKGKFIFIDSRP